MHILREVSCPGHARQSYGAQLFESHFVVLKANRHHKPLDLKVDIRSRDHPLSYPEKRPVRTRTAVMEFAIAQSA